jgi:hypothetical protein
MSEEFVAAMADRYFGICHWKPGEALDEDQEGN